jgi:hypothetical protein
MIDSPRIPETSFSLSGWEFGMGPVDDVVRHAVEETLNSAIDDPSGGFSTSDVYLPIMWHRNSDGLQGGPIPLEEADTVYFLLPAFGSTTKEDGPGWKFSISSLVDDVIELHDGNFEDQVTQSILKALQAKLLGCVEKLNEAIEKGGG